MSTQPPALLSHKQCLAYKESDARINIWQGAVRSGKTYSSLLRFIELLRKGPDGHAMIVGVTRDSLQRNIIIDLCRLLGTRVPGSKSTEMVVFGRYIYFVGANDESSVRRIQGSTLALALVDECTCIPEAFWTMLLSRLSVPGAKLLATCNPENPLHFIKTKYIDRKDDLDLKTWKFLLEDNPVLTESYINSLKKEYSAEGNSMWYKRYILGEWAVAQGLVYDGFDEMNGYVEDYPKPNYYVGAIDYGTTNPTCCLIAGVSPKIWPQIHVEDEYYYDSRATGRQKSDAELADDIKEFIGWRTLDALYIDPSAASLKIELLNRDLPVLDALHDVIPGIRTVHKFIAHKNIVVHKSCKNLLQEIKTYSWDHKAAMRGIDKPTKESDHACDALRYLIYSEFKDGTIECESQNLTIEQRRNLAYGERDNLSSMLGLNHDNMYF